MADPTSPYKVLQVDPEADPDVIQAAYRRLAQKFHPDVAGPEAAARMVLINEAWAILRDPASRAAYDREAADGSGVATEPTRTTRGARDGGTPSGGSARGPETVSRDWTSGRSTAGGGYDPATMRADDRSGAAGPPPGNPSGSVVTFGRYAAWSIGEIARRDLEYLEWLDRAPIGRPYREEIDGVLRRAGRRRSAEAEATERRGLFRRR